MTTWERLSLNLYVVSRAILKARADLAQLEREQAAIVREMAQVERNPDTSTASQA